VWEFSNAEDFFLEYGRGPCSSELLSEFDYEVFHVVTTVAGSRVALRLASREPTERIANLLEESSLVPSRLIDSPCKIFIGHGRDPQWRLLADHLRFSHGYEVVTYENTSTIGQSVYSVLDRMLIEASFAVLVHTAEFRDESGFLHAGPNVIHETGLFQARLGRSRALILRERGCQSFANIGGLTQLSFGKGNIREAFGDVVAALSGHKEAE
jgi:predicted nucleotide-binding protein